MRRSRQSTVHPSRIDLDLTVAYGLPIAEVARQVDSAVRYSIRNALGRDVTRLTIHVDGLRYQPGDLPGAPRHDSNAESGATTSRRAARTSPDGHAGPATAQGLLEAFRAAVANLEAHVDEINEPERLPGPGRRHRLEHVSPRSRPPSTRPKASRRSPPSASPAAISFGALMGARGNSGVITSQIFRGMAEGLAGKSRFNGLDLAHALSRRARRRPTARSRSRSRARS